MSIIDGYKQKAHQGFINMLSELQRHNIDDDQSETTHESQKKLIEQINQENQPQSNYEQEQYQYFIKKEKVKQLKCVVCKKIQPKYTCPKCKVKYCSIDHYKSHNLYCTERFYKQQVENLLKQTKMGKQSQKKMIEILKKNQQQMGQDSKDLLQQTKIQQISQQRLNIILQKIQNGEQVILRQNEIKHFQEYLREIEYFSMQNIKQNNQINKISDQRQLFQEYVPFWLINEGLQQYLVMDQSMPIEYYNNSEFQNEISFRCQASKQLKKYIETLKVNINFKKTSVFIVYDLVQAIYLIVLVFRSYNGEYLNNSQFLQTFDELYDKQLAKKMASSYPSQLINLATSANSSLISLIRSRLCQIGNMQLVNLLKNWLGFISQDTRKIFGNKLLCYEAIYKMLMAFKQGNKKQKNKKKLNRHTQIIKKLEFLLAFASEILYSGKNNENLPQSFKDNICETMINKIIQNDIQSQKNLIENQKNIQNNHQQVLKGKLNRIFDIK